MNIAGREIGPREPPYVIAEVSCNHVGSLYRALEMIEVAKTVGADAVKFQCVIANMITLNSHRPEFIIKDGPWAGRNLYELYKKTETPFSWFPQIKKRAEEIGITWLASVFDHFGVDVMNLLDPPAIKIASFEIVDTPLIKLAASVGRPMILSTGMASGQEIEAACKALEPYQQDQHALLHCVSGYPTPAREANLLRLKFGVKYGFVNGISDHSIGPEIPIAAVACGASIIEKHFRLSWHPDGEDAAFSLNEKEFATMVRQVRNTWDAMQPAGEDGAESEKTSRPLRRSLFCVSDIKTGEMFTEQNIRSIRPGDGAPPASIGMFIGQRAARDIARGEPMTLEMIK